jgi:extracellular elastinolytic metalloproteinase
MPRRTPLVGNHLQRQFAQRHRRRFRAMRVESLENRCLLAFSATNWQDLPLDNLAGEGEAAPVQMPGAHADAEHNIVYLPPQRHELRRDGYLTAPASGQPLTIALNYLKQNAGKLGLTAADFDNYVVTDQYTSAHNGVTHIYLRQMLNGLPIIDADLNINITREGRIINVGSTFIAGLSQSGPGSVQTNVEPASAFEQFASEFDLELPTQPTVVKSEGGVARKTVLSTGGLATDNVVAQLHYVPTAAGPKLAWRLSVPMLDRASWADASVSVENGEVLHYGNYVNAAAYNVYPFPLEDPNAGPRSTVVDPHDRAASPFGWHDINGLPGPDFFDTRGNNTDTAADRDGVFLLTGAPAPGGRASGGPNLNFDYPLNLTQQPSAYTSASTVNMFYWTNLSHDIHYRYGFTEAAGNFQQKNYSGLGIGGDAVLSLVQEGANIAFTNNAFFATPPDGIQPQMVFFEFENDLSVLTTTGGLGTLYAPRRDSDLSAEVMIHEYGHGVSTRLTGGPANVLSLTSAQADAMGEGWSDYWGLAFLQKPSDHGAEQGYSPLSVQLRHDHQPADLCRLQRRRPADSQLGIAQRGRDLGQRALGHAVELGRKIRLQHGCLSRAGGQ